MTTLSATHPEIPGECVRFINGWLGAQRCGRPTIGRLCEFHATSITGASPSVEPTKWVEVELVGIPDDVGIAVADDRPAATHELSP